jgi:hypothetical protein
MITRAISASMLFLPRPNSSYSKSLISAKLFDYLALRRPVLAIADKGSDIEDILQHTGNGQSFFTGRDQSNIRLYLEYYEYQNISI